MGLCNSQKARLDTNDIPINQKQKSEEPHSNGKLLLEQYHKLNILLDLLGNLDLLEKQTQDHINLLYMIRTNIKILIQYNLKKIMKEKNIYRISTIEDEEWLYTDSQFLNRIIPQFQQLITVLETLFLNDDFQNAFPILIHSFYQINESLKKIPIQYTLTQTRNTTL
ncbi:unnamed protein product (macronuclear) [Paramecium tetraurelia]|uniref:Uncharacterized protein n=1 Tax=Paramecium tetraurelia TaxID=5888 RepID=A0C0I2_PARTE|nr:uncharacterized protein GSPATT00006152001 [Paramecium tetraurelia]CAK64299.1 unnamed protein product [Paramecium tetraurelia]|eukprot:XP_001431697.1 hypothetical protein (macronuclear) [Paramecium tetraurelia strain d4-2]